MARNTRRSREVKTGSARAAGVRLRATLDLGVKLIALPVEKSGKLLLPVDIREERAL